jgi:hypothetical protein
MFQPAQNRRAYEELRSLPPLSELQKKVVADYSLLIFAALRHNLRK